MSPAPDAAAADLRIVSGGASPEDVAAVIAVLRGALDELAAANDAGVAPVISAWQRSQKPIRTSISPAPGVWRAFSA